MGLVAHPYDVDVMGLISSRRREARPAPLFLMSCLLKIESGPCITHSSCSTMDPSPSNGCVRSTGHRACCLAHGSQWLCPLERRSSRNPGSQSLEMRIASGGSNRFWRQAWALEGSAHDTDVIWLMKPERHPAIYRKYARRPLPQAWPAEDHSNTLLADDGAVDLARMERCGMGFIMVISVAGSSRLPQRSLKN
jgi:hypothetical protein